MKIKSYCNNLASCGETISEHEHVTTILNGLSAEFEAVITTSHVSYSVQAITMMLLNGEARQHATMVDVPSSANILTNKMSLVLLVHLHLLIVSAHLQGTTSMVVVMDAYLILAFSVSYLKI